MHMTIRFEGLLESILYSHGWVYLEPAAEIGGGFSYSLLLDGVPVTVKVRQGRGGAVYVADRVLPVLRQELLKAAIRHMLSLDFPLAEFEVLCRKRKAVRLLRLARKGWGRMFRSATVWEDAVKTLCTTNASWGYTEKMCRNLCKCLGGETRSGLRAFPAPAAVLGVGERYLKDTVGMGYRAKSLRLLAARAMSGEVPWLTDISVVPEVHEAEDEIGSWYGFGPYATRHLLMMLGFHDYLPIDREVGNHLGIRKPGDTDSRLDSDHFEDWGRFRFTAYKLTRVSGR